MNRLVKTRTNLRWTRGCSRVHAALAVCVVTLGFAAVPALAATPTVTVTASQSGVRLTTAGKSIRVLAHGRYRFVIRDMSRRCGFRLMTTAGVVLRTGRRYVGTVTRYAVLAPGSYGYACGARSGRLLVR
jgi:hypothetical protein